LPVLRALLALRADPNRSTNDGSTPLYAAAGEGHGDVVRLLLTAQAEPSLVTRGGKTPLINAVMNHNQDVVHALLQHDESRARRAEASGAAAISTIVKELEKLEKASKSYAAAKISAAKATATTKRIQEEIDTLSNAETSAPKWRASSLPKISTGAAATVDETQNSGSRPPDIANVRSSSDEEDIDICKPTLPQKRGPPQPLPEKDQKSATTAGKNDRGAWRTLRDTATATSSMQAVARATAVQAGSESSPEIWHWCNNMFALADSDNSGAVDPDEICRVLSREPKLADLLQLPRQATEEEHKIFIDEVRNQLKEATARDQSNKTGLIGHEAWVRAVSSGLASLSVNAQQGWQKLRALRNLDASTWNGQDKLPWVAAAERLVAEWFANMAYPDVIDDVIESRIDTGLVGTLLSGILPLRRNDVELLADEGLQQLLDGLRTKQAGIISQSELLTFLSRSGLNSEDSIDPAAQKELYISQVLRPMREAKAKWWFHTPTRIRMAQQRLKVAASEALVADETLAQTHSACMAQAVLVGQAQQRLHSAEEVTLAARNRLARSITPHPQGGRSPLHMADPTVARGILQLLNTSSGPNK